MEREILLSYYTELAAMRMKNESRLQKVRSRRRRRGKEGGREQKRKGMKRKGISCC